MGRNVLRFAGVGKQLVRAQGLSAVAAAPLTAQGKVMTQPLLPREIDTCMLDIVH